MRRFSQLAVVMACSVTAFAQYIPLTQQVIINSQGLKAGAFSQVSVCAGASFVNSTTLCSPTISVYSNPSGAGGPVSQPFSADQNGNFTIFVAPNLLTVSTMWQTTVYTYQVSVGPFGAITDCGGQVFNVMCATWGATGNGVTNDTAAVVAADAALNAAGGGTLFFPHGTYLLNPAALQLGSNTQVLCADTGTLLSFVSTIAGAGLYFGQNTSSTQTSNVSLRNCQITMNQTGGSATNGAYAVSLGNVNGAWVEDNYIHDAGDSNIIVDLTTTNWGTSRSSNVFIKNNIIGYSHNLNTANVQIGNGNANASGPLIFDGNTITERTTGSGLNYPLDVNGFENATFSNNKFIGGLGVQVENGSGQSSQLTFTGNDFISPTTAVFSQCLGAYSYSSTYGPVETLVITDNRFTNCTNGLILEINGSGNGVLNDVVAGPNQFFGTSATPISIINHPSSGSGTLEYVKTEGNEINGFGSAASCNCGIFLEGPLTATSVKTNLVRGGSGGTDTGISISSQSNGGQISIANNNLGSNSVPMSFSSATASFDNYPFSFTPSSSSYNYTLALPIQNTLYRLTLYAYSAISSNVSVAEGEWIVGTWAGTIAGSANVAVTSVANQTATNGSGSQVTLSVAGGVADVVITASNADGQAIYGTLTQLQINGGTF